MLHPIAADDLNLGHSAEAMLEALPGPVGFRIPGRDPSRCRVVSTLLHGNEPSGIRALHAYLISGARPTTDLYCVLGAVEAARWAPRYSHRFLPGGRDLNRCFRPPFSGREGALAQAILRELEQRQPEALIDLHNTSGRGPCYAVATSTAPKHHRLATLFTDRVIVSDLKLGALTEVSSGTMVSIVVECGGSNDPAADRIAIEGLQRFAAEDDLSSLPPPRDLLEHPVRLELAEAGTLTYSHVPDDAYDVVLLPDVDRFNFGSVPAGQHLGWVGSRGLGALQLRSETGTTSVERFLRVEGRRLIAAQAFRPLMITTRVEIALSDCLLYAVAG